MNSSSEQLTTISPDIEQIIQNYQQVRQQSEDLCAPLKPEDYAVQPVAFVSPAKWNLAHVSWFFETFVLQAYKPGYQVYSPDYAYFFNSYYESQGKRVLRADRGNMTRPTTEDVYAYRTYVNEQMLDFLENVPALTSEMKAVIELGLNHEQQHQELMLTDLKYILAHNPLFPAYQENAHLPRPIASDQASTYLEIEEGLYPIGYNGQDFHFDNEKGVHQVFLHAYRIADRLVSTAEYLEFMKDGGYEKFQYWLSPGWEWVQQNQIQAPLYWHQMEGEWHHYTLQGLQKVDPRPPITHISLYEADAFANWKGKRLATEFEWEVACQKFSPEIPKEANFLESNYLHPVVQDDFQFYGSVWEWTNSAYLPYPYYQQAEGALGEYNGKFMMGQMVLRGGSCATPRAHIRPTYRNFFYPHERWQFTGIRLAEHI